MGKEEKSWYGIYGETILKILPKMRMKKLMNMIHFLNTMIGNNMFLDKTTITMK